MSLFSTHSQRWKHKLSLVGTFVTMIGLATPTYAKTSLLGSDKNELTFQASLCEIDFARVTDSLVLQNNTTEKVSIKKLEIVYLDEASAFAKPFVVAATTPLELSPAGTKEILVSFSKNTSSLGGPYQPLDVRGCPLQVFESALRVVAATDTQQETLLIPLHGDSRSMPAFALKVQTSSYADWRDDEGFFPYAFRPTVARPSVVGEVIISNHSGAPLYIQNATVENTEKSAVFSIKEARLRDQVFTMNDLKKIPISYSLTDHPMRFALEFRPLPDLGNRVHKSRLCLEDQDKQITCLPFEVKSTQADFAFSYYPYSDTYITDNQGNFAFEATVNPLPKKIWANPGQTAVELVAFLYPLAGKSIPQLNLSFQGKHAERFSAIYEKRWNLQNGPIFSLTVAYTRPLAQETKSAFGVDVADLVVQYQIDGETKKMVIPSLGGELASSSSSHAEPSPPRYTGGCSLTETPHIAPALMTWAFLGAGFFASGMIRRRRRRT